jgi:hypothetical protein
MTPQIFILDENIFKRTIEFMNVTEMKTFNRAKLITNTYTIPVNNDDDYFSINNPKSNFSGADWRYSPVTVFDRDANKIWEGAIFDIIRDHRNKTAQIICKNTYFNFRNRIISYQSSTWETGAAAFKEICDAAGFTKYNLASINASDAQLADNGCKLKVDIQTEDGQTFIQTIETLAELSNAYLYVHNDELYFVHWVPFTGGISASINGNRKNVLREAPIISSPETEIINEYSIDYYESGKVPATDANSNNIGIKSRNRFDEYPMQPFRTGSNQQIVFMDKQSAIYIGEGYMRKTNRNLETDPRPPERIGISLFADNDEWVNLQSTFEFSFAEEGWTDKIFEVFEFTIDDDSDAMPMVAWSV